VAAARQVGLRCVAIPGKHADVRRFAAAELVLSSAAELDLADVLGALETSAGTGAAGNVGDAGDLATA
jgi:putative hydrolase of the HAD superfamily